MNIYIIQNFPCRYVHISKVNMGLWTTIAITGIVRGKFIVISYCIFLSLISLSKWRGATSKQHKYVPFSYVYILKSLQHLQVLTENTLFFCFYARSLQWACLPQEQNKEMSWLCNYHLENFHTLVYVFKKKNPYNATNSVYFIVKVEKNIN